MPHVGPSVASDIYTIGRTLVVLAMEFRGYQSTYVSSLPPVDETPLFQKHDSLYRLLLKACAPDPADRFVSADELRVQLLGVLREVVALERGGAAEHSTSSLLFDVPMVSDDSLDWQDLPTLRADDSDPQMPWLRTVSIDDPVQRLAALESAPSKSPEVLLAQARAALEAGSYERVDQAVHALLVDDRGSGAPSGCPVSWPSPGREQPTRRARSTRPTARCRVSSHPSWLSPSPARPAARLDVSESLYTVCARTDANYIAPAAFGLARIRAGRGDIAGAVSALDLVPATSRAFTQARRRRAGLLAESGGGLASLAAALESIDNLTIDPLTGRGSASTCSTRRSSWWSRTVADTRSGSVAVRRPSPRCATDWRRHTGTCRVRHSREERVHLVDQANLVRRWTLR